MKLLIQVHIYKSIYYFRRKILFLAYKFIMWTLNRFMPTRDQTESITTHWILVALFISRLVMVATGKRCQSHMLMSLETVRNLQLHQTIWVASVPLILPLVQQQVSSVGTDSLIIALSEKVASVMGFSRCSFLLYYLLICLLCFLCERGLSIYTLSIIQPKSHVYSLHKLSYKGLEKSRSFKLHFADFDSGESGNFIHQSYTCSRLKCKNC